jgi:hypothetical protein
MNEATARLTVPMDKSLRTKLGKKADDLGFDSPQALLRYVSKALVDGREVTFGIDYGAPRDKDGWDDWGPVPDHVRKQWDKQVADYKAGKAKTFDSIEEGLKYLNSREKS